MSAAPARQPDPDDVVRRRLQRMAALRLAADASGARAVAALRELAEQLRRDALARRPRR